ncbi:MAG: CDP-alcohol phosphatidyltransferase family protein, partial [Myxococcota bacterium]|nr:CDP-alcohol phosphatidyltransferase family protein [Myxococcota bacterium]
MLTQAARVYRETRKKHDQLFNVYFMRPIAAVLVAAIARTRITPNQVTLLNLAIFVGGVALLIGLPTWGGGLAAVAVIEVSYCFDCVDGMLARFKRLASRAGHLFDFFTDELKAILLVAALAVRAWRSGGVGVDGRLWSALDARFLLAGIAGAVVVASALSLTNFVRNPELSGRGVTVEAYYETVLSKRPKSGLGQVASWGATFLRFLNHYPSHLWVWALAGRLEVFFWIWVTLNALYL